MGTVSSATHMTPWEGRLEFPRHGVLWSFTYKVKPGNRLSGQVDFQDLPVTKGHDHARGIGVWCFQVPSMSAYEVCSSFPPNLTAAVFKLPSS